MVRTTTRVARFFLVHDTKPGKMHQMNTYVMYQNLHKIFQIAIKYINIFLSKALQNLPKLEFMVEKKPSGNPDHDHARSP
jgi:hypothetical protein